MRLLLRFLVQRIDSSAASQESKFNCAPRPQGVGPVLRIRTHRSSHGRDLYNSLPHMPGTGLKRPLASRKARYVVCPSIGSLSYKDLCLSVCLSLFFPCVGRDAIPILDMSTVRRQATSGRASMRTGTNVNRTYSHREEDAHKEYFPSFLPLDCFDNLEPLARPSAESYARNALHLGEPES